MKILELGKFYPPHLGGMETLVRSFCRGFARRGAAVRCVVANDGWRTVREQTDGIELDRLANYGEVASTSICPAYLTSTRRIQADIWHHHFPNPLADLACCWGSRRPMLVMTYHSDVVRQSGWLALYGPLLRRVLARANRIVVGSPQLRESSSWLRAVQDKVEVIPFGLELARFAPSPATLERADELRRLAKDRPVVLTIGRLVEYKGQRYLLEAARDLAAEIWMVGTGPLEGPLRKMAGELGLTARTRFWGAVAEADLPAFLHACDVFALPSITPNEAFGLVQIEAMACGKPVVSCRLRSGVSFVNQDQITGRLVEPADPDSLAEALSKLLNDARWRKQLGEAGRDRAHKEFAEETMIGRYWDLFRTGTKAG